MLLTESAAARFLYAFNLIEPQRRRASVRDRTCASPTGIDRADVCGDLSQAQESLVIQFFVWALGREVAYVHFRPICVRFGGGRDPCLIQTDPLRSPRLGSAVSGCKVRIPLILRGGTMYRALGAVALLTIAIAAPVQDAAAQ